MAENRSGRNGLEEGVIFWRDLRVARKTQKKIGKNSVGYVARAAMRTLSRRKGKGEKGGRSWECEDGWVRSNHAREKGEKSSKVGGGVEMRVLGGVINQVRDGRRTRRSPPKNYNSPPNAP